MAYNAEALKNLDIFTEVVEMKKRATIFFDTEAYQVITPSIQSNPEESRFDIMIGNIGLLLAYDRPGIIAIRYFEDILVGDLQIFKKYFINSKYLVFGSKSPKIEYTVKIENGNYSAKLVKDDRLLPLVKFGRDEFIYYLQQQLANFSKINSDFTAGSNDEDIQKIDGAKIDLKHLDPNQLIIHIHSYITSRGFNYSLENIKNLYLSLRVKPFVIISGISGTGKTKIVQLFAESLGATEDNGQFKLVPVRPDWSDGSDLLGYRDISGEIIEGQLTKIVRKALGEPDKPYFLLLDEMNLARVEYYFSDVLSIMESRKIENGKATSAQLVPDIDPQLTLPKNLYIIGTVNMDETTHPFSKKVLDRANTIEFNDINLSDLSFLTSATDVTAISMHNNVLEASYIQLKDAFTGHEQLIRKVSYQIEEINKTLELIHAQVGYRVRDEICFYMIQNVEGKLLSENEALDFCYMQKILPRISGAGLDVEELIDNLISLFEVSTENGEVKYPRSVTKLKEMKARYNSQGFVSFWIS